MKEIIFYMEIKIRPAIFADLDTILEIINHQILNSTSIYDYEPRNFETHKLWFDDKLARDLPVIVAETENKGWEFSLNGTIIDNPEGFSWDAGVNFYTNKNQILSL